MHKTIFFITDFDGLHKFIYNLGQEEIYAFSSYDIAKKNLIIWNSFLDFGFMVEAVVPIDVNINNPVEVADSLMLTGQLTMLSNKEKTFYSIDMNLDDTEHVAELLNVLSSSKSDKVLQNSSNKLY
ncbi:hypothetical protein [Candidatus Sulfurimonas baltica]|uniref:Uncharacterized protein n=1 Tax=Candidatus Sulfurimonas baltica TaxID=2740404 RepID=A0A7S7RP67_9BACT|nr:hypothetical protein [Candidatus Sulfurimonas baltica]QOY53246.1 hypothetical protein HUE88_06080 [Candidatus Sulfurimonas baltica]